MSALVVTGTDTGVGKTIFAAGLTAALGATYWKPVQCGLNERTDAETARLLSGRPVLPEAYRLHRPAAPHLAAKDMGIEIDCKSLSLPQIDGDLVIEGAGGVMVPLTPQFLFLDLFARWQAPVVLVARTTLGTINHSALSISAMRRAGCILAGIAFIGNADPEVEETICEIGDINNLGRLPHLSALTQGTLSEAFTQIDVDIIRSFL